MAVPTLDAGDAGASDVGRVLERVRAPSSREALVSHEQFARSERARMAASPVFPAALEPLAADPGACRERLDALGVTYRRAPANPGIEDPIVLYSPINGVRLRWATLDGREYPMRMDCRLALAIHALAGQLRAVWRIRDLVHYGAYEYRCMRGSEPCRLSYHARGLALDIAALRDEDGVAYSVRDNWSRHRGPTCPPRAHDEADQLLQDLACWMYSTRAFSAVLTPNYNLSHENHFHVQVSPQTFGDFDARPHVIDPLWVPHAPGGVPADDEEVEPEIIEAIARDLAEGCEPGACPVIERDTSTGDGEYAEAETNVLANDVPLVSLPARAWAGGDRLQECTVRRRLGAFVAPRE